MMKELLFGIQTNGIRHTEADGMPDIDTRFAMVRDAGVFDYVDKTPGPHETELFLAASEKYDLPVRAGGWFYCIGKDEDLLEKNLEVGGELGSAVHNVQVLAQRVDGKLVSNEEIINFYERALELGEKHGVMPCLEVHVNMWSEDFRRVTPVGRLAEDRSLPFRMTLDHSHVIFKIDNPREQEVFNINPGPVIKGKKWHHFAGTYDAKSRAVATYVDGKYAKAFNFTGSNEIQCNAADEASFDFENNQPFSVCSLQ